MKHDITINCDCGCGAAFNIVLRVEWSEGEFAYINTLIPGFYANQRRLIDIIKYRVKLAWLMLRGKDYYFHEVALDKRHWNEFVDAVNKVGKID